MASSEEALRKSIDVSEQHYADAYFVLANLYVNAKRFADAEPVARKGAAARRQLMEGSLRIGLRALWTGPRRRRPKQKLRPPRNFSPTWPETRLLLANIHIHLHKYPAVLEDLNAYLKLEPNGAHADQARQLRDQVQTALEKAQAAAQERPTTPTTTPRTDEEPDSK